MTTIIDAIKFKGSTSFVMGLTKDNKVITVHIQRSLSSIEVSENDYKGFHLYKEDIEYYEKVSIDSFFRALKLAKHRLDLSLK